MANPNHAAPMHYGRTGIEPFGLRFLGVAIAASLVAGSIAYGASHLFAPVYTSRVTFLPPQQQQSAAASAIASLGAISGLVGAAGGLRSPADQYVALLQSASVADRLIDEFKLLTVYEVDYVVDARERLAKNVRILAGKSDGMVSVEVDDKDAKRASEIANRHVDELRRLTGKLTLSEAQQRRAFFESHLAQTRDRLALAQQALQSSGFNAGALKAEPKAAAEGYSRLRAEVTGTEIRLQALRQTLTDAAPEVQQATSVLAALRRQLAAAEVSDSGAAGPDYIGRYREYKYQETLFEMFARQYELARVDESREGAMIQVVDVATPAEKPSRPRRWMVAGVAAAAGLAAAVAWMLVAPRMRRRGAAEGDAAKSERIRGAMGGT